MIVTTFSVSQLCFVNIQFKTLEHLCNRHLRFFHYFMCVCVCVRVPLAGERFPYAVSGNLVALCLWQVFPPKDRVYGEKGYFINPTYIHEEAGIPTIYVSI